MTVFNPIQPSSYSKAWWVDFSTLSGLLSLDFIVRLFLLVGLAISDFSVMRPEAFWSAGNALVVF
jgi:hypothetical protein